MLYSFNLRHGESRSRACQKHAVVAKTLRELSVPRLIQGPGGNNVKNQECQMWEGELA